MSMIKVYFEMGLYQLKMNILFLFS